MRFIIDSLARLVFGGHRRSPARWFVVTVPSRWRQSRTARRPSTWGAKGPETPFRCTWRLQS